MKNNRSFSFVFVAVFGLLLTAGMVSDKNKSLAEAEQIEGLYIFTDCKPVAEYEYVGTVKSNTLGFGDSQYTGVRDRLIKNCKKDYPEANGIIITLVTGKKDKADAIRIK